MEVSSEKEKRERGGGRGRALVVRAPVVKGTRDRGHGATASPPSRDQSAAVPRRREPSSLRISFPHLHRHRPGASPEASGSAGSSLDSFVQREGCCVRPHAVALPTRVADTWTLPFYPGPSTSQQSPCPAKRIIHLTKQADLPGIRPYPTGLGQSHV